MRVLVCGSRHFNDYKKLEEVLDRYEISGIISGAARGADSLGEEYAKLRSIPVVRFPALWDTYGRRAGPIRNSQMLKEGQPKFVVAFRANNSRGTRNMIDQAKKAGVETMVVDI